MLAELGVLVVMVFWAGNFIVVKGAIGILPPVGFTFLRYCVAAVSLVVLLRLREGAIRLPRGDVVPILVLGVIGFGCYQILWPVALQTIPAGDSALLIATTPVITALLAMATGADTPNAVKLIGAFVSFAGVALVIAAGQGLVLGASLVGDALTLVAAACWAVYTVFGAGILRRHSPLVTTTWAIVAGTLFIAPLGIAQLVTADLSRVGPPVFFAILYSGTLAAGFASTIFAPLTAALETRLSWRGVYLTLAAALAVITIPAHMLSLPWIPRQAARPVPARAPGWRHGPSG